MVYRKNRPGKTEIASRRSCRSCHRRRNTWHVAQRMVTPAAGADKRPQRMITHTTGATKKSQRMITKDTRMITHATGATRRPQRMTTKDTKMITRATGAIKRPRRMITKDTKMITHVTGGQTAAPAVMPCPFRAAIIFSPSSATLVVKCLFLRGQR